MGGGRASWSDILVNSARLSAYKDDSTGDDGDVSRELEDKDRDIPRDETSSSLAPTDFAAGSAEECFGIPVAPEVILQLPPPNPSVPSVATFPSAAKLGADRGSQAAWVPSLQEISKEDLHSIGCPLEML